MPEHQTSSSLAQSFDTVAAEYAEVTSDLGNYVYEHVAKDNLRLLLSGKRFRHVLDAGGGIGKWIPFLAEHSEAIDLVDISAESVRLAKDSFASRYGNVTFTVADLEHAPFPDRAFDLVFAQGCVLSYTPDPGGLLREFHRILAPNGFMWLDAYNCLGWALESPNPDGKVAFASVQTDMVFRMPDRDYPARMFRSEYLRDLIENSGFRVMGEYGSVVLINSFTFLETYGKTYDPAAAPALAKLESELSRDPHSRGVGKNIAFLAAPA